MLSLTQLASALCEYNGTLPYLQWARTLTPFNHHPHLLLADLEPRLATQHWQSIRSLHPLYAPAWIRLGLDQEVNGDAPAAETTLLRAAELDRTFLPQWTLANYYFRHGNEALFWKHVRRAASVYQGDLTGVFQLGLHLESDPVRLWQRLNPTHPPARMDLLRVLLTQERYTDAARIASHVAAVQVRGTRELLLAACDQANDHLDVPAAIEFWNAAARHGWITRPALDPAHGVLLADGAFQHQPTGSCFDWRTPRQNGVYLHPALPAGLRIELTGRQKEDTTLASLRIPVKPHARYRLSWRYSAELHPNSAPPVLRINDRDVATWETNTQGQESVIEFNAGPSPLAELTLSTQRTMGATRPEGKMRLEWVAVKPL